MAGLLALALVSGAESGLVPPAAAAIPVPVVFDTDMDFDDAAALAYLSQEHKKGRIDLRVVTVTNSGVGLPGLAIRNARCVLGRFGLGHVPVADGSPTAPHPEPPEVRLVVELIMTTVLLGCLEGTQPGPVSAAQLLADHVRSASSDVVLIATGPCPTWPSLPEHSVSLIALDGSVAPRYWWGPLAAMAATRPGVVGYRSERIVVVQGGARSGRTAPSPEGRGIQLGVSADQARFEQTFIDTLNGRSPVQG